MSSSGRLSRCLLSVVAVAIVTSGVDGAKFTMTSKRTSPPGTRMLTNAHTQQFGYGVLGLQTFDTPYATGTAKVFNLPNGEHVGYLDPDGTREYLLKDNQGTTVRTSEDNGAQIAEFSYDPYGEFRNYNRSSTAAGDNMFMYTGGIRDRATGLYRLGARWYDPTQGRFTQPDPSGQEQNAYLYTGGNPVNATDATGLDAASYYGSGIAVALFGGAFSVGWAGFSSYMAEGAAEGSAAAAFWGGMGAVAVGAGIGIGIAIAGLIIFQNV